MKLSEFTCHFIQKYSEEGFIKRNELLKGNNRLSVNKQQYNNTKQFPAFIIRDDYDVNQMKRKPRKETGCFCTEKCSKEQFIKENYLSKGNLSQGFLSISNNTIIENELPAFIRRDDYGINLMKRKLAKEAGFYTEKIF